MFDSEMFKIFDSIYNIYIYIFITMYYIIIRTFLNVNLYILINICLGGRADQQINRSNIFSTDHTRSLQSKPPIQTTSFISVDVSMPTCRCLTCPAMSKATLIERTRAEFEDEKHFQANHLVPFSSSHHMWFSNAIVPCSRQVLFDGSDVCGKSTEFYQATCNLSCFPGDCQRISLAGEISMDHCLVRFGARG